MFWHENRAIRAGSAHCLAVRPPDRHAGGVEFDRPDEDAYGRVTNPERYQVAAIALIATWSGLSTS